MPKIVAALAACLLLSGTASAQERLSSSELTGVTLPEPSWDWNGGETAARHEAVKLAAAAAGRSCGQKTEFHAFQTSDPEGVRTGTISNFESAGWTLEDFSEGTGSEHIYRASREGAEVVMTWVVDAGVALLVCESFPSATAVQAAAEEDDEALDLTKSPHLFAAAFGAIGLLIVGAGVRSRRKAAASERWPTTAGIVLESSVLHKIEKDFDGDEDESWVPLVKYSYEVGGVRHESDMLRFGRINQPEDALAAKMLAPYPAGASVKVRYNPEKPSEATLETAKPGIGSAIFIGGFFLFFAALATVVSVSQS